MPNPNILFMSQPAQGVGTGYENALIGKLKQNEIEQMPIKNRLLEAQTQASELTAEDAQYLSNFRDMAVDNRKLQSMMQTGDFMGAEQHLASRSARLQEKGVDNSDTLNGLEMIRGGNIEELNRQSQLIEQTANDLGIFEGVGGTPAGVLEFEHLTQGLTQEQKDKAKRVNLGLDPRAGQSADERIARDAALASMVAQSQGRIAGAKEGAELEQQAALAPGIAGDKAAASEEGKLNTQQRLLPPLEAALAQAKSESTNRGEKLNELGTAKAMIPGLKKTIGQLKALASEATFTASGKAFNALAKEFGYSTKGGTARSQMTAIVDNQVLPMLRPIFGSAFTAAEGDRLRAAFLNPDSTPNSRVASLNAFLSQAERNINALERETGGTGQAGAAAVSPQAGPSIDDLVDQYGD